jgi:hypothetical protein
VRRVADLPGVGNGATVPNLGAATLLVFIRVKKKYHRPQIVG